MNDHQKEFENQRAAGRQLTLQDRPGGSGRPSEPKNYGRSTKKEVKPKGHEAFLKALETSQAMICVEYLESIPSDPMILIGVVKHSDAYTISLDVGGTTHVVFKHAVRCFTCMTPRKEEE